MQAERNIQRRIREAKGERRMNNARLLLRSMEVLFPGSSGLEGMREEVAGWRQEEVKGEEREGE